MSMLLAMMLSSITARGIINPIVVAAPAGGSTGLYFVLRNSSRDENRLLRVTCACAARIELLTARGADLDLSAEPVVMPPERLVELRPGAARQLRLLRLTRPLVAGQTMSMTFHYADGSETRDVAIVAEPFAGWAAGTSTGARHLALLEALAGSCWRSVATGGRPVVTRCFSPAYGMFMQERQGAQAGGAPFVNHVMYSRDVMGMTTSFRDNAPAGAQHAGRVVADGDGLLFEDYPVDAAGRVTTRTSWRPDGPDAWLVRGEMRFPRGWRESWRIRLVRAGPSPPL